MLTKRFPFAWSAMACAILIGLAGCKKAPEGGDNTAPVSSPTKQEEPAALNAKELAAAKQASVNNLHQLGIAMLDYHDANNGYPTPGYALGNQPLTAIPWDPISWRVKLLPYLEQQNLYRQINPALPMPQAVASTVVPTYLNPLKKKTPTPQTHYRVFVGGGALFDPQRPTRFGADIADGTANTILVVESAEPVDWSKPEDFLFDPTKPLPKLGIFPGGFHALMADASVRWIPADTPEATIKAMITRSGNDYVELPGDYVQPKAIEGDPKSKPAQPKDPQYIAVAKAKSANNLKQIGLAMHNHEAAWQTFPSAGLQKDMKAPMGFFTPHSWRVTILPYIEQDNLWKLIPNNGQGALPKEVADAVIKLYVSPLNKEPLQPITYYRVFVGNGAAFEWGKTLRVADFTDGLSNTIFAVECAEPVSWTSLDDFNYDPKKPLPKLGIFPGGFNALMGDGSVRWIPADTPEATIRAMITRNGGEAVKLP